MRLIMDYVGQPSEEELLFLTDHKVKGYINNISMGNDGQSLMKLLPKCGDEQLLALLDHLLTLNPYERWSAAEALKSPIFDEIRNKNAEKSSKQKI